MRFHDKLRRKARQLKAVNTSDPEGVLATLQVTRRLLLEASRNEQPLSIMDALKAATAMSAPKDAVVAYWAALRVIFRHTHPGSTSSLAILADAIEAQGKFNHLKSKGPQA